MAKAKAKGLGRPTTQKDLDIKLKPYEERFIGTFEACSQAHDDCLACPVDPDECLSRYEMCCLGDGRISRTAEDLRQEVERICHIPH